jgi:hypothetical protein
MEQLEHKKWRRFMSKKFIIILIVAVFLAAAVKVSAQDVLMNSAETINLGNLKLAIFPTLLLEKNGRPKEWGVFGRFGYGLTARVDIEAKVGIFKNIKYFGGDIEYWFIKGQNFNVSAAVGGHITNYNHDVFGDPNNSDSSGFDTVLLASTRPFRNLEIYGGFKLAVDSVKNADDNPYLRMHFVPGIEYRISDDLDFLAEVGIPLKNYSRPYASIGFALYVLR